MGSLIGAIATLAIVLVGLGVVVGKVKPGEALGKLGVLAVVLCLAPVLAGMLNAGIVVLWKPLIAVLVIVVILRFFAQALFDIGH